MISVVDDMRWEIHIAAHIQPAHGSKRGPRIFFARVDQCGAKLGHPFSLLFFFLFCPCASGRSSMVGGTVLEACIADAGSDR
jgi:hypothetical protein